MTRPNFFIAGEPKSGTTAIQAALNQHPDIFMSSPKEPHFFADDITVHETCVSRELQVWTEAEYLDLYADADSYLIRGEASSGYLYSKNAAENIYNFSPKAKILAIFREPVDFLISLHMLMNRRPDGEGDSERNFCKALRLEESRRNGLNLPPKCRIPQFLYYSEWIRYSEQLKRYDDIFPSNQIMATVYDDFVESNEKFIADILTFLGCKHSDVTIERKNVGYRIRSRRLAHALNDISHGNGLLGGIGHAIKSTIPSQRIRRVGLKIAFKNYAYRNKDSITPEFRSILKKKYKPEVEALSNRLDRDLIKLWKY